MRLSSLLHVNRVECRADITIRQPILIILTAVSFGWYIFALSSLSALVFYSLAFLLLASYVWARQNALCVSGSRKVKFGAVQVGDELEEVVELTNDSFIPVVWAEFVDQSDLPGYTVGSVRALGGNSRIEWTAHAVCKRRGVFQLGPWSIIMGDPFGIFEIRLTYPDPVEILVLPQLSGLPAGFLSWQGQAGDMHRMNQPKHTETNQAFGVRTYYPGDSLHRVHWPTTARRNELFVKSFEPESIQKIWLFVDFNRREQVLLGDDIDHNTVEFMAMLTASLAGQLLRSKLNLGLIAGGEPMRGILPQAGQTQYWKILREISRLQPIDMPLEQVIHRAGSMIQRDSSIIVITPSTHLEWISALTEMPITQSRASQSVIWVNPLSFRAYNPQSAALPQEVLAVLQNRGIPCQVLQRGDLKPISGAFGRLNKWEFKTLGTGRVIIQHQPGRGNFMGGVYGN